MATQDLRKELPLPQTNELPLDVERMKQLAYEQREGLALLAKTDGPAETKEDTKTEVA